MRSKASSSYYADALHHFFCRLMPSVSPVNLEVNQKAIEFLQHVVVESLRLSCVRCRNA
jgi:hypothetical protein